MTHEEFVESYHSGRLAVAVDRSAAMRVLDQKDLLPARYRAAHLFWKNLGCLLPVAGLVSLIWLPWYWGLGAIVLGMFIMPATRRSAAQFVMEHALEDAVFWETMVSGRVITIRDAIADPP